MKRFLLLACGVLACSMAATAAHAQMPTYYKLNPSILVEGRELDVLVLGAGEARLGTQDRVGRFTAETSRPLSVLGENRVEIELDGRALVFSYDPATREGRLAIPGEGDITAAPLRQKSRIAVFTRVQNAPAERSLLLDTPVPVEGHAYNAVTIRTVRERFRTLTKVYFMETDGEGHLLTVGPSFVATRSPRVDSALEFEFPGGARALLLPRELRLPRTTIPGKPATLADQAVPGLSFYTCEELQRVLF